MKLSIITINLNNVEGLRKTIESVVSQTFTDFEYIVIDGGSTDGSVDIIKQYADKITYWVSEADKGIYNAMNKGILQAKGEYCLFLNSGDWLVDNNVVKDFCNADFKEDIVSGNIFLWEDENNSTLMKAVLPENLTYSFLINKVVYHQSTFIRCDLFSMYGLYNEAYKIVSDWEFFIKVLIINNCSYINFDKNIAYFAQDGISCQQKKIVEHKRERSLVCDSLLPRVYKMYDNYEKEMQKKQKIINEYMFLKKGNLGFIVRLLLKVKQLKKQGLHKTSKNTLRI